MAKGFTLLETIIAVAILATGIVASLTLISKSIQSVSLSQNRLIATYLANEGMELVRNIRDNNWKDPSASWDDGLADCADCGIDYEGVNGDSTDFLKFDPSRFYNYTSGVDTMFRRRIAIATINSEQKQVTSEIIWSWRGGNYNIQVEGFLYNWQ